MAVLIEAISVVIRRVAIERNYPGAWGAFVRDVPNQTLCADRDIARVGFMSPSDVGAYVMYLEGLGLKYKENGKAKDLVVVDQQQGPLVDCDWVEYGYMNIDDKSENRVAVCRLCGSTESALITPDVWKYEGSLSHSRVFVPSGDKSEIIRFLRNEGNTDVYLNTLTGEEVYIGKIRSAYIPQKATLTAKIYKSVGAKGHILHRDWEGNIINVTPATDCNILNIQYDISTKMAEVTLTTKDFTSVVKQQWRYDKKKNDWIWIFNGQEREIEIQSFMPFGKEKKDHNENNLK